MALLPERQMKNDPGLLFGWGSLGNAVQRKQDHRTLYSAETWGNALWINLRKSGNAEAKFGSGQARNVFSEAVADSGI